jgi:hypothetical protein
MARVRLSDITLDKVGGIEEGLIVVATKSVEGITKGKQYVLHKSKTLFNIMYYVTNDRGWAFSEMKFFVKLEDWRDFNLKDLGL